MDAQKNVKGLSKNFNLKQKLCGFVFIQTCHAMFYMSSLFIHNRQVTIKKLNEEKPRLPQRTVNME